MLEERINELKKEIISYALHVDSMMKKSFKGFGERDKSILDEVTDEMENKANEMEIKIEEQCIETIAQFEPKAKNLRLILMILKMNNDLERVGDHAVNISGSAKFLIDNFSYEISDRIMEIEKRTEEMLNDSIDSFIEEEPDKAKGVCEKDDLVDDIRDNIIKDIIPKICTDPHTIDRDMHLIRIAKNIERIADLSTNICEDVIYYVEGKIIKHYQD